MPKKQLSANVGSFDCWCSSLSYRKYIGINETDIMIGLIERNANAYTITDPI